MESVVAKILGTSRSIDDLEIVWPSRQAEIDDGSARLGPDRSSREPAPSLHGPSWISSTRKDYRRRHDRSALCEAGEIAGGVLDKGEAGRRRVTRYDRCPG